MRKINILIIVLFLCACGITAEIVNSANDADLSGFVDFKDFAILANSWYDGFDTVDLASFANDWLAGEHGFIPLAVDFTEEAVAFDLEYLSLSGSDPINRDISFYITTLPTNGWLQDSAGFAASIKEAQIPFRLSSQDIAFVSGTTGVDAFGYKTKAQESWSEEAIVTLDVAAAQNDYLYFEQQGQLDIPDANHLDITDGWGLTFWLQTRQCDASLVHKRGSGAGYEVNIKGGYLQLRLYNPDGLVGSFSSYSRVNTGEWILCGLKYYYDPNGDDIEVTASNFGATYEVTVQEAYTNDANLVIVPNGHFIGRIDHLRYFSMATTVEDIDLNWSVTCCDGFMERRSSAEVNMFGYASSLRWMCDDGTGMIVTEDKTANNGLIIDGENNYWVAPRELHYKAPISGRDNVFDDCIQLGKNHRKKVLMER